MSIENQKTLEIYDKVASLYLLSSIKHDKLDIEAAKRKKEQLQKFLKESFSSIPKGSNILEIGSGDGENAKYLQQLGYNVIASDVASDFLKAIKEKGLKTIKFNVLEDDFLNKYFGILCYRVFVHFTKDDMIKVIKKIYDSLEKNGIFVFNVMSREGKDKESEWLDFEGEYHLGIERYFHYYYKEELDELIREIGYEIVDFHKSLENNKWLVYTLRK